MDAERELTRILILTEIFPPCPQAPSQRVYSFAQGLSLKGCKVTILTGNRCFRKSLRIPLDGLQVYNLRCSKALSSLSAVMLNPLLILLYLLFSVVTLLKQSVEAIMVSVPNGDMCVAGFLVSKLFGLPLLIDMRDFYPPSSSTLPYLHAPIPRRLNRLLMLFFTFLYRNVEKVSCVDLSIKKRLKKLGVYPGDIVVVPNGADTSVYMSCTKARKREKIRLNYGLSLDKLILVYAGSLVRYYPVRNVINALKAMSSDKKGIQLLVISLGDYTDLETYVRKLGIEDAVKFMGPLRVEEASVVLSACDVGVAVYRAESIWKGTFGSKIFSYMACGLPVLASGPLDSVLNHLVSQNKVGIFVGEPTRRNFAKHFSYILNNREKMRIMGRNARKLVEKSFDRKKISLRLISAVKDMVYRDA